MATPKQEKTLLDLIDAVDNVPLDFDFTSLYALLLPNDPRPHGYISPSVLTQIPWTPSFTITHSPRRAVQVHDPSGGTSTSSAVNAAVNAAFQAVIDALIAADANPLTHRSHSELFLVPGADFFCAIERFPAPMFGILSRGAHCTAYVPAPPGGRPRDLRVWVARRADHLFSYPGMLDTTIAGGVKAGDTPLECVVAEAGEEASLDAAAVREGVRTAGAVTYVERSRHGHVSPTVLYVYDLPVGEEVRMEPRDDEVAEFHLWGVERVTEAMLAGRFKPNCNLVMIDFFVRHGVITQEEERDYLDIMTRLHRRLPVPTAPRRRAEGQRPA
ncbi:NUDIX domain-containing protein [Pleurostoma richardsiae]|uniref:NUDIX domain-containing protein n=1 Tax=Pleurostoma richardsiae TaxID=41990 RepID=A0AA38S9V4_9PEZI|nr:NUDIX domain-containing protein [Pleurostoma richardsiae]